MNWLTSLEIESLTYWSNYCPMPSAVTWAVGVLPPQRKDGQLKGTFWFQKSASKAVFFGFNIMFDHKTVHVPNIGSLAHS